MEADQFLDPSFVWIHCLEVLELLSDSVYDGVHELRGEEKNSTSRSRSVAGA